MLYKAALGLQCCPLTRIISQIDLVTFARIRTGDYIGNVPYHATCCTDSPVTCRVTREAEANKQKLTPEFLQMSFMTAISNNTKMYFGDKLPSMLLELHQILPALQGQLQP